MRFYKISKTVSGNHNATYEVKVGSRMKSPAKGSFNLGSEIFLNLGSTNTRTKSSTIKSRNRVRLVVPSKQNLRR